MGLNEMVGKVRFLQGIGVGGSYAIELCVPACMHACTKTFKIDLFRTGWIP